MSQWSYGHRAHQIIIIEDYSDFKIPSTVKLLIKKFNGNHILWNEESIKILIQENFDSNVLLAYNTLKANALKADLARYCILYVHGGWYFDLLMTVDGDLGSYSLDNYNMLVFRDIPNVDSSILPVSNSIIWTKEKNNKVLKYTIDMCVANILNNLYPRTSHRITGPTVFGKALATICLEVDDPKILVGDLAFCDENGYCEFTIQSLSERKGIHFAWHRLPETESELPDSYQKGSIYDNMFYRKELYKKEQ